MIPISVMRSGTFSALISIFLTATLFPFSTDMAEKTSPAALLQLMNAVNIYIYVPFSDFNHIGVDSIGILFAY